VSTACDWLRAGHRTRPSPTSARPAWTVASCTCTAVLAAVIGWGAQVDEARSRDAGVDLHLTKPAAPEALQPVLQQLR